jgi:hypothetical protein
MKIDENSENGFLKRGFCRLSRNKLAENPVRRVVNFGKLLHSAKFKAEKLRPCRKQPEIPF